MQSFIFAVSLFPFLTSFLVADAPPALPPPPKNPVLVAKEASPYPTLHARTVNKRFRKYLTKIFKQTEKAARHGYNVAGIHIVLDKQLIKKMQHGTKVIHHPDRIKHGQKAFSTQIMVTRREVMGAARELALQGLSTVALNEAHQNRPGDSVFWGKQTEEAALFRVSDYFLSLLPHLNPTLKKQLHNGKYHVPEFGGIYSPHVLVFRENQELNFRYIAKPIEIAIIASAPYNMCHHSSTHHSPGTRGGYVHGTKEKIRAILRIAAHKKHTAVVFNDFGCVEHHNHPKVVSRIFKDVLLESEFKGVFKVIDFAMTPQVAITSQLFVDFSRELNGLVQ